MKWIRNILIILVILGVGYYFASPKQVRLPDNYPLKDSGNTADIVTPVDNSLLDKIVVYYYDAKDMACANPVAVTLPDLDMRKRFGEITALNALLTHELPKGYKTAIIPGTQLNQFNVRNGIATLDMGTFMTLNTGSCGWASRKAQVVKTVNQFNTYKDVIITVEGKSVN